MPQKEPEKRPEKKERENYILKPEFSKRWLRLFWISRRFSIFVYSASLVAFFFVVLQVSFFAYVYIIQAEEKPLDIYQFHLEPAQLSGWEGSSRAKDIDLLSTASRQEFSEENSAVFRNKPITEEEGIEEIEAYLAGLESEFAVGGYELPKESPAGGIIRKANLVFSLAADTYEGNEDVVTFSYSYDGDSWYILDSFALTEEVSNATNEGFWTYPLEVTDKTRPEDMENLRVKVAYSAVPGPEEAKTFIDGIALAVDIQEPDPVVKEIEESVEIAKKDFAVSEKPKISVAVDEDKFLGIGAKKREVKSVKITDPSGLEKKIDYEILEVVEGDVIKNEYVFNTSELSRPGKYTVSFAIEQEGRLETVERDFTWGVLAFNPDQSVYKSGQSALFSIGVVDDNGQPVCDAEVTVEVTDPGQQKTILTTNDGSITVSEYCTVKDVYVEPDYSATYTPPMPGEYKVYIAAVHHHGRRTLNDSFSVELSPTYTIKRDGPTRVFPNVMQPMRLTVTAYEDFNGEIKDYAQRQFNVEALDGGIVRPFDTGEEIANEIVWQRSIPAGTSVTVSYNFDAPPKSPALFHLGPAKIGDWDEGRQWQLAIDPANMLLLGKTSSAPGGWSYVSTYNGRYIRGSSTYGGASGSANHSHTVSGTTRSAPSSTSGNWISGTAAANAGHTHSTTNPTVGNAQNIPAYARFTLWSYDSGIPSTVPQNAYALFDADPGGDWTRYSTADNRLIQLNSAQGTSGSDTHTHSLTWTALGTSGGTIVTNSLGSTAANKHTHTAPSGTTSDLFTSVPQYTTTIIYEQTNATPQAVPYNMMALFDATPPTDWTVVSGLGGDYDARFVQGNTTEGTKTGSNTHSMADQTSGASGSPSSTTPAADLGSTAAGSTHTHTQTSSFSSGTNHMPQYVNVIIAQYKGVTVSGTVYQNDESSNVGLGQTVDLYVNGNNTACAGAACSTKTNGSGVYTFSNVAARSGDIITVAANKGTYAGSTVLVSNGATISDLHIYDDAVIVRHDTGTSITNSDLESGEATFDYYNVTTNNLVVDSGYELHIWTGDTYDPGGTVTTNATGGDMHVDNSATAYLDTATSTIGIDIDVDASATLNVQASTTVNGNDVTVNGTLNHTAGTFTIGNSTTEDLIVNSGATVNLSGGTTNIKDDLDINGGTTTISNTVNLSSASTTETIDMDGGTLNINTGADVNVDDRVSMDDVVSSSTLNLNDGSLDSGDYWLIYEGTLNLNGGDHNVGSVGYLYFNAGAGDTVYFNMTDGEITTKELYVTNNNTFTTTITSGGTINVGLAGQTNAIDMRRTDDPDFYNITIEEDASIDALTADVVDVLGTFTINTGKSFDLNGESLQAGSSLSGGTCAWDSDGTFTHTNGKVIVLGGDVCGDTDATFYDLIIGDGTTTNTISVKTPQDPTVANTLTVDAGDTLSIDSSRTVTHSGTNEIAGTGTISGAGKVTFTNTSGGPGTTLTTLSSVVRYDATGGNIAATTFDARIYEGNVEAFSNVVSQTRSITMAAGTQQFNGNLTVTSGFNQNLGMTLDGSNNPTVNISGSLTFIAAGAAPAIISGTDTWTMTGSTINFSNGTYTATAGNTFKINHIGATLTPAGNTFQNFEVSGGATSVSGAMDVDGTFTVSAGTYQADDNTDLNVAGDFTIESGAVFDDEDGTGKLILDGDLNFWDKNGSPTNLGEVEIGTSPDTTDLKSDFKADSLTINIGDNFNTHGYDLDIGGDITTGALSTLNATDDDAGDDTYINLEGTLTFNNSTAFTEDQSTVTFDATSGTQSIVTNGAQSLYHLVIDDGGGGSLQVNVDDSLTVNGNLTVTDGRLNLNATTNVNLDTATVNDILTVTAGTFTVGNGTTEDLVVNAGATVSFSGGIVDIKDVLDINGGSTTISNTVTVGNDIDQDGGTLTINAGADVDVTDQVYLSGSSSTLDLNGGSLDSTDSWYIDYGTFNLDGGDHNITNGFLRTTITSFETLNFNMTGGALTVGALVTETPGILNTGTPSGSTINIGGSYATKNIEDKNANAHSFYNMVIEEDAEIDTDTTEIIKLDGSFTINSGKTFTGNSEAMQIAGGWTNNGGTFTAGGSTITLTGGNISGTADTTFNNLTIDGDVTVSGTDDPTVSSILDVDTGDTLTINSSRTVTLNSTGSLTLDGIITGDGRLIYMPSAAFPTGGIISSILRFDATDTDQTMSNRIYGGAVEVYNTSDSNLRTVTASSETLTFNSSLTTAITGSSGLYLQFDTNDPSVTVNGTLTNNLGVRFEASGSSTLTLKGDYTNNNQFYHNNGTVVIGGTAQQTFDGTMTGATGAFNNLTITNAGAASPDVIFANPMETDGTFTLTTDEVEVQFEASSNYTFNDIDWNGTASDIVLTSSSGSTAWNIKVETVMTESVSYINVTDSGCQGGTQDIWAFDGTNTDGTGNGACWLFDNQVDVSGVLYDTTRSTPFDCTGPGSPYTIKISTSGRAAETTTCTTIGGAYSFTDINGPLVAGDPVIVYVDSAETPQATTVTRGTGPLADITLLHMYQNDVIVRHEDAGPLTNVDMNSGDNGDTGIRYVVQVGATNNLTVDSGLNLYVWAGDEYDPGGTVTTQGTTDLYVAAGATASLDTATNTITDDIDNYGTLNITGTTNVTDDITVQSGATLNSSSTVTSNDEVYVYGDLNVTAGTFTVGNGTTEDLVLYTGGTFDPSGGTTDIKDDLWIGTGGVATITADVNVAGMVNVDAGTLNVNTGADVDIDEIIDQDGGTININDGATNLNSVGATSMVYVDNAAFNVTGGTLTVGTGSTEDFQVNSGSTVTMSGGTVNIKDDLDHNGGTTTITNTVNLSGGGTDESIDLDGGTLNINAGADVNVDDQVMMDGGSTLDLNGGALDSGDSWLISDGTLNLDGGTHGVGTDGYLSIDPNIDVDFNMTGGSITTKELYLNNANVFTQTTVSGGTIIIGTAGSPRYIDVRYSAEFFNITIAGDAEIDALTSVVVDVPGTLTINNGITFDANGESMRVGEDLSQGTLAWDNDGSFTYDTSTITVAGGDIGGDSDTTFYDLTISSVAGVTVTESNHTVAGTLTVEAFSTLIINSGRTVTHTGSSFSLVTNATITGAGKMTFTDTSSGPGTSGTLSSWVRYDATGGDIAATTFDARIYGGNVGVYSNVGSQTRSVTMASGTQQFNGNLTVTSGIVQNLAITLDGSNNPTVNITGALSFVKFGATPAIISGTGTWTVTGNVDFTNGTFSADTNGTLKMNGTTKTITSASQTLQNFEVSGGSISNTDILDVNGNFSITGGGFTQGGNFDLSVDDDVSFSLGTTFTKASGSGDFIFDGNGEETYTDSTASPQNLGDVAIDKTDQVSPIKVTLLSDMTVDTLSIDGSGGEEDILDLGSYTLELANAGTTATVLTVDSGATLTPGTSTVKYSATNSEGNIDVATTTYNSLQLSGSETYDLAGHLTSSNGLTGNLTIDFDATLDVTGSDYGIDLAGNWTNNSGEFEAQAGTVTLDGTSLQTLSGGMVVHSSFNHLTVTNSSGTDPDSDPSVIFSDHVQIDSTFTAITANTKLQFQAGKIFDLSNIVLNGQDTGTRIYLRSTTGGSAYQFYTGGTVSYVNVQDSHACPGGDIDASDGTNVDSGNNECWNFGVTVEGTLYLGGEPPGQGAYNCSAVNKTIAVVVNGSPTANTTECVNADGTWSVDVESPPQIGDPIVAFIDNETGDVGTTVTRVSGISADISNMDIYEDAVIVKHEDAGPITNLDLFYAHNLDVDIIYGLVGSDLLVNSGVELHVWTGDTYDPGTKVTTQGTGGDLHVDDDATAYLDTATSAISDTVYVEDGATLDIQADTTVSGGAIITGGTDATISYTGTPTVTITGTGNIGGGTTPSITFYNLIINGTQTMVSATTTDNDLTVGGTMKGSASVTTTVKGSATGSGTVDMSGGTVEQRVGAAENFGSSSGVNDWTFNDLTFSNSSPSADFTVTINSGGSGDIIANGTLTVGPSADSYDTILSNGGNNRVLDIENVTIDTYGELQASASEDFTVSGNWSNSGAFTHNNGTVTFDATDGDNTVAAGNSDFYGIEFSGADAGDGTWTVQTDDFSITNTLNVNDGDTLSINSGRTVTWTGDTFGLPATATISGSGRLTIYSSTTIPTTGTLSSVVRFDTTNALTIVVPQRTFGSDVEAFIDDVGEESTRILNLGTAASQTINISGNLNLIDNNVAHLSLSGATDNPDVNVNGDVSISGTNQSSSIALGDGDWDVDGSVTIASGATVYASATGAFNVGGNWDNNGTFTHSSGAITFDATDADHTINPGSSSFYDLTFNGSSGVWSPLTNTVTVTNDLIMTAGTFDTSSGTADVTVNGDVECLTTCGTINMSSTNTFTQSVSAAKNFGTNVAVATNWIFYNLLFDSASGTPTITFNGTGTGDINVLNDFSLNNRGTSLTVDNETSNDRVLNVDNDVSIGAGTTFQASSDAAFTVAGSWTNSGAFTANSGTVTFDSDDWAELINGGSSAFNNVDFDHVAGGWNIEAAMDVDGTFDLTNGQFGQGANVDLNVAGNFTLALGTSFDDASGTGKVIFDGDLTYIDNTSPQQDVGNVEIGTSPDTTDLDTDMKANSVTVKNGDTLETDGYDLDLGQNGLTVENGGTLDATDCVSSPDCESDGTDINTTGDVTLGATSTFTYDSDSGEETYIIFDGTGATTDVLDTNSVVIYNLTINGDSDLDVDLGSALDIDGDVTINQGELDVVSGSDWDINVGGDWLNADTFTAQNGTVTFDATDTGHTINTTASSFYNLTFDGSGGGWSPKSNFMAVSNDMIVTNGSFNTSAGVADVSVNGNVQCGATCGTINMTSNTFRQFVSANKNFGTNVDDPAGLDWTFNVLDFKCASGTCDITINGTGTGDINVLNLYLTNVGTSLTVDNESYDRNLDIDGSVTIGANTTLQASSTATFEVGGNWSNSGDFTDGTGTVTLDGTGQQTVSGQLTGASDRFNNLTITNASGADPDVIFSASAETASTFLAETASTQLQFLAGGTYTFQNIDFDGLATGTRVELRSSSTDTQWDLNVAGTRSVSNTNVRDSNACGQAPDIDATDGTNQNATNNSCWLFETITFSISDVTIGFSDLSSTQATWATANEAGSASATSAHNLRIATNAANGYVITYNGSTLTSGSDTITVGDWTDDENGTYGDEEFAISMDTDGDATIATGYDYDGGGANADYEFVVDSTTTIVSESGSTTTEIISIYYITNIAGNTEAGNYTTSITYIVTSTFQGSAPTEPEGWGSTNVPAGTGIHPLGCGQF